MTPELQPVLTSPEVILRPLQADDFEALYAVASDPAIWEQHPNPDRYQRQVFTNYFKGAMESRGALLILDSSSGEVIGSSRYYDLDTAQRELKIGYTFFAKTCWGKGYNRAVKILMINHAFEFVSTILFHVGITNHRSRRAMEKLGAHFEGELEVAYYGESPKRNAVYTITRSEWSPRVNILS